MFIKKINKQLKLGICGLIGLMVIPSPIWASDLNAISSANAQVAQVNYKEVKQAEAQDEQVQGAHESFMQGTWSGDASEEDATPDLTVIIEGKATYATANQHLSFKWNRPEEVLRFEIQLADLTRNKPKVYNEMIEDNFFDAPEDVDFGKYRFWVRAQHESGEWGAWSYPQTIDVDEKQAVVTVHDFLDNTKVMSQELVTWQSLERAIGYEVWIGKRASDGLTSKVLGDRNVVATHYDLPKNFESGEYAVWVRGIFESGDGVWVPAVRFQLEQAPTLDDSWSGATLEVHDYSEINGYSVLEWPPADDALSYDILLLNQRTGEKIFIENQASNRLLMNPQSMETSFVVQVKANKTNQQTSGWSASKQIDLKIEAPVEPLIHYSFDEPVEKKVTNQAGENKEGYRCSAINNPGRSSEGVRGQAANFEQGADQGYLCDLPSSFSTSSAWSVGGWFKTDIESEAAYVEILGNMNPISGFSIRMDSSGSVKASLRNDRTDFSTLLQSQPGYRDGKWHHVALSFDESAKTLVLYLDGKRADQVIWPYGALNLPKTISVANLPNFLRHYAGEIDEVKVYDRALLEEEVAREVRANAKAIEMKLENQVILDYPNETPKLKFTNFKPDEIPSVLIRLEIKKSENNRVEALEMTLAEFEFQKTMELAFSDGEGFYDVRVQYLNPESRESVFKEENVSFFIRQKTAVQELLYVAFATPRLDALSDQHLKALRDSPYSGLAVPIHDVYGTEVYDVEHFRQSLDKIESDGSKPVWPWVFTNIMYGTPDEVYCENCRTHCVASTDLGEGKCSAEDVENYYSKIRGVDIYDEVGALSKYLQILEVALEIAKENGAPGIVIDSEFYNNYGANNINYLATIYEKSVEEIQEQLEWVGAQIADLVDGVYPEAVLLFMTTALDAPQSVNAVIFRGILKRAKSEGYGLTVVEGGETSGYIHGSKDSMRKQYESRYLQNIRELKEYPNFKLGGTNAPFSDYKKTTGWVRDWLNTMDRPIQNINEHESLLKYLFQTNEYVWIYGAGAAPYNMYWKSHADLYNPVLDRALEGHIPGAEIVPEMMLNQGVKVTQKRIIQLSVKGLSREVASISYAVNSREERRFGERIAIDNNAIITEMTLPSYYGMNYVNVRLHDKDGSVIKTLWQSITLEKVIKPELVLNGGLQVTSSRSVEIDLRNLPLDVVSLSYAINRTSEGAFSSKIAVSNGSHKQSIMLPAYYGKNYVNVRLHRADGSIMEWLWGSIELIKQEAPKITINGGVKKTKERRIEIALTDIPSDVVRIGYAINQRTNISIISPVASIESHALNFNLKLPAYIGNNYVNIVLYREDGTIVQWLWDWIELG